MTTTAISRAVKITDRQRQVLKGVTVNARPSFEIADSLREETHWIASPLKALQAKGLVECTIRGGKGLPSYWRLTKPGQQILKAMGAA